MPTRSKPKPTKAEPVSLPPPAHLSEAGAKIWRDCAMQIAPDGALSALQSATLEALVHAILRQRLLATQIEAAPSLLAIVPALKQADACAGTVRRLAASLGLTGAARQQPRAEGGGKWADLD